jgi:hypothetical protein
LAGHQDVDDLIDDHAHGPTQTQANGAAQQADRAGGFLSSRKILSP